MSQLQRSFATTARVLRDRQVRSLLGAFALSTASGWAYAVALAVFAYRQGGPSAVGLLWLVLMVPAGVAAPFLAALADRFRSERVLALSLAARGALMLACAAAVFVDVTPLVVFGLAIVASLLARLAGPAQAATLPRLVSGDEGLAAANTLVSQIEALATVAGPAIAGLLLAFGNVSGAILFAGLGVLSASLLAGRILAPAPEVRPDAAAGGRLSELVEGVAVVARDRSLRVLVALFGAQTFLAGALNVFLVIVSVRLVHLGESGVGFLNGALGVGGGLGAFIALVLAGRHLPASVRAGLLLWGLPLTAVAIWPDPLVALAALACVGAGNTLLDVGVFTSIQQSAPPAALGRVFGVIEGIGVLAVGLGALAAPALVAACGIRWSLAGAGLALALGSLVTTKRPGREPAPELALAQP
jgi:MFS family permease